jgi:hypothetical protein
MCSPHCWQYAKPIGVGVPQRGHVTVRSPAGVAAAGVAPRAVDGPEIGICFDGGTFGGIVGGRSAPGRGTDGSGPPIGPPFGPVSGGPCIGVIGPVGGIPADAPYAGGGASGPGLGIAIGPGGIAIGPGGIAIGPGGGIIPGIPPPGAPPGIPDMGGDAFGPDGADMPPDAVAESALPQLRQNFIPGGFSPRQTLQVLGNPWGLAGVCCWYAGASELPQFRQNDDPGGLSWPHIEQRIGPLTLISNRVSQQHLVSGMAAGRFATHAACW